MAPPSLPCYFVANNNALFFRRVIVDGGGVPLVLLLILAAALLLAPPPPSADASSVTKLEKGCKLRLIADSWLWEKLVAMKGSATGAQKALDALIDDHLAALNAMYSERVFDERWTNLHFTLSRADIEVWIIIPYMLY